MRYAVPRGNKQFAAWPEPGALREVVRENGRLLASYSFAVLGVPAREMRRHALDDLAGASNAYAREIGIACPSPSRRPIIATGHQCEFFHAGVWIKNHLAFRLACATGGVSVNLIVDNDIPKHLALALPLPEDGSARHVDAALAPPKPGCAYEEYGPEVDVEGFAATLARAAAGAPFEASAAGLVDRVRRHASAGLPLRDLMTVIRAEYERDFRVANAELPVSRLAVTPSFGLFAQSLFFDARRMAEVHNAALAAYRRARRIRNSANPVPDLHVEGKRIETPFWVWRNGCDRRRLFLETTDAGVTLSDEKEVICDLPRGDAENAARAWTHLTGLGVKIRPRALTLTMFTRLFAADIFIHGVGGGIYDEVTDAIIRGFYGVEPPRYATATATMTIPWGFPPPDPAEAPRLVQEIRAMRYNPQRFLSAEDLLDAEVKRLVEKRERLILTAPDGHEARTAKWQSIRAINERLGERTRARLSAAVERLEATRKALDAASVLFNRDYSFFLLPREDVESFYAEALAPLPPTACPRS